MIVTKQGVILKAIQEDEEKPRIDHREVYVLAYPSSLSQEERACNRLAGSVARDLVAQERPHECRLITFTLSGSNPRVSLDDGIVSRRATNGALRTEARYCGVDELWVDATKRLRPQTQLVHDAGAEVVNDHIDRWNHRLDDTHAIL